MRCDPLPRENKHVRRDPVRATIYADEIAALCRDGGDALGRTKLGALTEEQRHVLREALAEPVLA